MRARDDATRREGGGDNKGREGRWTTQGERVESDEGATVIGHGIFGKDIPIMARLAKARRWSKR
jgi:hypothetical protein